MLDPDDVRRLLSEQTGETVGKFALGDPNVSYEELYHAVAVSWISMQNTPEAVFSPENHRIVDFFVTP